MSLRLGARLVAVLLPAVVLLPAAAHAEKVVVDDAVGDAKALNLAELFVGAEGVPSFLDAPAEASVDITRTVVAHGGKRLTVSTHFRDLVGTTEHSEHSVDVRIFTPDGRFSLMASMSADGSAQAQLFPDRSGSIAGGRPRPCRTVRARYDVDADLVTMSLPTACIGAPRWVQVAVMAGRFSVTPLGDGSVNLAGFADDAFRSGLSMRSRGRSPKVRRG